ncbi:hypothetical protein M431DRAFT_102626, partial [Trichoderma harzianum CBS 226.95]
IAKFADIRRIRGLTFKEGDIQLNIKTNRLSNKLNFKKLRPYKVIKKIKPINYKINLLLTLGK